MLGANQVVFVVGFAPLAHCSYALGVLAAGDEQAKCCAEDDIAHVSSDTDDLGFSWGNISIPNDGVWLVRTEIRVTGNAPDDCWPEYVVREILRLELRPIPGVLGDNPDDKSGQGV